MTKKIPEPTKLIDILKKFIERDEKTLRDIEDWENFSNKERRAFFQSIEEETKKELANSKELLEKLKKRE